MNLSNEHSFQNRHPIPPQQNLADYHLQLCCQLQTTLQLSELIEIFHHVIKTRLQISGVAFHPQPRSTRSNDHDFPRNGNVPAPVNVGNLSRHSCHYDLRTMTKTIGRLQISRGQKFTEAELQQLESVVALLVYPLHNALQYEAMCHSSRIDALTGVNNRASLDETLERELKLAKRQGTQLSLLMIDVDHFKQINDKHGHQIGDEALKIISQIFHTVLRETDRIFRYGGDEFVVLLDNTDEGRARLVGERLRMSVEKIKEKNDWLPNLSITVGIATLLSTDDHSSLFKRADLALYRAKKQGRNRVEAILSSQHNQHHIATL